MVSDCLIDHIWLLFHTIFPFYAIDGGLNHEISREVNKSITSVNMIQNMIYRYTGYIIHQPRGSHCHISFELL